MKVAVLLLLATCVAAQEVSNGPLDKPGYEQPEAPDKQVEYVTGPNVGIVGPTVLGGKGQEVQPSGEELPSTDKEQRDISAQAAVYSGYQEVPRRQDEFKGHAEGAYAKYAALLNYNGMRYVQTQEHPQYKKGFVQKKPQVAKNSGRPSEKVTYYQSDEPARYSQEQYYVPQQQEQHSTQLHDHIPLNRSPMRGPQEYQPQTQGQEERKGSESQAKSDPSTASQESSQGEENEGQQTPTTNETPVYVPQEYLQYQLAPQEAQAGDLQSALQFPGKHQLQLFLPQEATGPINVQEHQVTPVQNPHLQPIQNGHQIQYIPAYITSQSATLQKERQPTQVPQHPSVQIISQPQPAKQSAITLHNAHSSSSANPGIYHRAQPYHHSQLHSPQLHSNFQPSQHQPTSPFANEPTQYHPLQQSNEAIRRPQAIQLAQKPFTPKPNPYSHPQGHPTIYRPKSPQRLPPKQPEHLALISQAPPRATQHRQTHDKPLTHQPEQAYQPETQSTDDKLTLPLHTRPYVQKFQTPLHIQSPTPFPIKVVPAQPQVHIPLTHYELTSDKVAVRPFLYPIAAPNGQPVQTEIPHQALGLIPTEAAKLYNDKIPSYIKALEQQADQSKPFGFSQMSYGKSPGSYSYSIFNKHS